MLTVDLLSLCEPHKNTNLAKYVLMIIKGCKDVGDTSFRDWWVVWAHNFIQFFFLFVRGWRIQWSIVPEVSEPMVRRPPTSCLTASCFCVSGGKSMLQWRYKITFLFVVSRSLQRKTWLYLRSSSLYLMLHKKHRYNTAHAASQISVHRSWNSTGSYRT